MSKLQQKQNIKTQSKIQTNFAKNGENTPSVFMEQKEMKNFSDAESPKCLEQKEKNNKMNMIENIENLLKGQLKIRFWRWYWYWVWVIVFIIIFFIWWF